jgi:cation:H+ antiporter
VLGIGLLAIAAILLTAGAELYTTRVRSLAERTHVTAVAIGLLLAGAEPEELVTATIASARGHPGIAAGDAIGANVTMLSLVLGALAMLQPLPSFKGARVYLLAASGSTALVAVVATAGSVSRLEGGLLVVAYLAFFGWVVVREHRTAAGQGDPIAAPNRGHPALAVVGLGIVTSGGWFAVAGAERVVTDFGLAQSGVGLTVVALATSAELFALIWAARRHAVSELALVAILGSVIGNATATMGGAALVHPVSTTGVVGAAWLVVGLTGLLFTPPLWTAPWCRPVGVALLTTYCGYCILALT